MTCKSSLPSPTPHWKKETITTFAISCMFLYQVILLCVIQINTLDLYTAGQKEEPSISAFSFNNFNFRCFRIYQATHCQQNNYPLPLNSFSLNKLKKNYLMHYFTWKFTQKQRGKQESRALTIRRRLGDLEPKLPKTTASAPQSGRLANTKDFQSSALGTPLVTPHIDKTGRSQSPKVQDAKSKSNDLQVMSKPVSMACTFKSAARTSWARYIGWHWNVCFNTHKKSII